MFCGIQYYLDGENAKNRHVFLRMVREVKLKCRTTGLEAVIGIPIGIGHINIYSDCLGRSVRSTYR